MATNWMKDINVKQRRFLTNALFFCSSELKDGLLWKIFVPSTGVCLETDAHIKLSKQCVLHALNLT